MFLCPGQMKSCNECTTFRIITNIVYKYAFYTQKLDFFLVNAVLLFLILLYEKVGKITNTYI
jgi:hypothetical protein